MVKDDSLQIGHEDGEFEAKQRPEDRPEPHQDEEFCSESSVNTASIETAVFLSVIENRVKMPSPESRHR